MYRNRREKPKNTRFLFFAIACLLICGTLITSEMSTHRVLYASKRDVTKQPDTILVFAPHPDDEVLGNGGLIQKEIAKKKRVVVVMMTDGDGFKGDVVQFLHIQNPKSKDFQTLGVVRHQETINALGKLGVPKKDIIFLGYPDRGLSSMWTKNWNSSKPFHALNGSTYSPYIFAYQQHALYSGENLVRNIIKIVKQYNPSKVVFNDPYDQHIDHWGTYTFVKYALTKMHYQGQQWNYLVHGNAFLEPWETDTFPEADAKIIGFTWIHSTLNKKEQQNKNKALQAYSSQILEMKDWMLSFEPKTELYELYHDPVVPTIQKPFSLQKTIFPHLLFKEPVNDKLKSSLGDVLAIGGARYQNQLYIGVLCKKLTKRSIIHAQFILMKDKRDTRIYIDIPINTYMHSEKYRTRIEKKTGVRALIGKNQVWLQIPSGISNGTKHIFLSIVTSSGKRKLDDTLWRMVSL